MRLFVVVQRFLSPSESWVTASLDRLLGQVVGIAGRTIADPSRFRELNYPAPFFRLRSRNIIQRLLPKSKRGTSPWSGNSILLQALKSTRADRVLVHYGTVATEHWDVWSAIDLPVFVHFHGFDAMFDMRHSDNPDVPIHAPNYAEQVVNLSHRARLIVNSEFTKSKLVEVGVDPSRISLKYIGTEPDNDPKQHEELDWPTIVSVGRLVECKGVELTVQAFARMRQLGVQARLKIIGDGPERGVVEQAIRDSGFVEDIELTGWMTNDHVRKELKSADVYTVHNRVGPRTKQEEALNLSVLEAMATGLPVVATKSGGVSETVINGQTGLLIQPMDIEGHAKALAAMVSHVEMRATMGRKGWERVCQKFTIEQEMDQLTRILNGEA